MKFHLYSAFLFIIGLQVSIADSSREYTVGIIPYLPAGEFVVADAKGLYKKEGLNVKSIYYTNTGDWVRALSNGKLDFSGLWNATQIDMYYRGSKAKRLALMSYDSDDYKMIIRKGATPQHLKGKRIAVFSDYFGTHWFAHNFMDKSGLSLRDVKLIEMTNQEGYKNFIRGRVDGMIFNGKYMGQSLTRGEGVLAPIDRRVYLAATTGGPSYFETENKIPRKDLKKFLRAWVKAMLWIEDESNAAEYKRLLIAKYNDSLDLVGIENDIEYANKNPPSMLIPMKDMYKVNKNMGGMFVNLNKVRVAIGYNNDREYDKNKMYDNSLILEVLKEFGY